MRECEKWQINFAKKFIYLCKCNITILRIICLDVLSFNSALGHVKEPTIFTSTSILPIVKYETLYVRHVKFSMRYECRMKNGDDRAWNGSFESFEWKIAILWWDSMKYKKSIIYRICRICKEHKSCKHSGVDCNYPRHPSLILHNDVIYHIHRQFIYTAAMNIKKENLNWLCSLIDKLQQWWYKYKSIVGSLMSAWI